ncbi:MAG: ribonuclease HII [Arcobacteraceae bacterium]|jgi:ribonuclease HII|nr:ribonuclease HII [Arcobacteraceae bacterium]
MKKLCGIDEAGRGPLAGPLCVAGVVFKNDITTIQEFAVINDSKKLTEKKREALFEIIKENSHHHIVLTSNHDIDRLGIAICIKNSIVEIMEHLKDYSYLMDGNTSFGIDNLEYLIKADATIKEVSAASILAKVTRDRFMDTISNDFPEYCFIKHKGYGTKLHIDMIRQYGKSELHRLSYRIKGIDY